MTVRSCFQLLKWQGYDSTTSPSDYAAVHCKNVLSTWATVASNDDEFLLNYKNLTAISFPFSLKELSDQNFKTTLKLNDAEIIL